MDGGSGCACVLFGGRRRVRVNDNQQQNNVDPSYIKHSKTRSRVGRMCAVGWIWNMVHWDCCGAWWIWGFSREESTAQYLKKKPHGLWGVNPIFSRRLRRRNGILYRRPNVFFPVPSPRPQRMAHLLPPHWTSLAQLREQWKMREKRRREERSRVAPAAVVDDDDDSEPDFDAVLRAAEKDERGDECIDADDFDEVSDNDSEGEAAAALLEQLRK
eukprot:gene23740-biopygen13393